MEFWFCCVAVPGSVGVVAWVGSGTGEALEGVEGAALPAAPCAITGVTPASARLTRTEAVRKAGRRRARARETLHDDTSAFTAKAILSCRIRVKGNGVRVAPEKPDSP